jgi:hypothetical protein
MAFLLEVQTPKRPSDLVAIWKPALAQRGIVVEFPPGFKLENSSAVLVVKVLAAPASLTRLQVSRLVAGYFEVWCDEEGFGFRTASGRTTVDFALQCLCAAALAEHLDGLYVDPQMGESARGNDAFRLAMAEIGQFIEDPDEEVFRDFIDWQTV